LRFATHPSAGSDLTGRMLPRESERRDGVQCCSFGRPPAAPLGMERGSPLAGCARGCSCPRAPAWDGQADVKIVTASHQRQQSL